MPTVCAPHQSGNFGDLQAGKAVLRVRSVVTYYEIWAEFKTLEFRTDGAVCAG